MKRGDIGLSWPISEYLNQTNDASLKTNLHGLQKGLIVLLVWYGVMKDFGEIGNFKTCKKLPNSSSAIEWTRFSNNSNARKEHVST